MNKLLPLLLVIASPLHAFSWHDLWVTPDRQAQAMMSAQQFEQAKKTFKRDDWRAAAAFRAGDYEQAAALYASLNQADGFYNQGNALAHMKKYEQAIKAYDKALAINPHDSDALYNRKIVDELLKKTQQERHNQPNKEKSDSDSQKNASTQTKDQDKQNTTKEKQNKNPQNTDEHKQQQTNDNSKTNEPSNDQQRPDPQKNKQQQTKQSGSKTQAEREQQQANAQWLRLIPDDPGGLLREKFRRDYLSRQRE